MRNLLGIVFSGLLVFAIIGCQNKTNQEKASQNKTDQAVSTECDRECLEGFVDQYLTAIVVHDPSRAPFAKNARYTENADEISNSI